MKLSNLLLISLAYFANATPGVLRSKNNGVPEDDRVSGNKFAMLFLGPIYQQLLNFNPTLPLLIRIWQRRM